MPRTNEDRQDGIRTLNLPDVSRLPVQTLRRQSSLPRGPLLRLIKPRFLGVEHGRYSVIA